MTFTLACKLSNKLAAIASVAGTMTIHRMENCSPDRTIPVLLIHGTSDGLIPYNGGHFGGEEESGDDEDVLFASVNQVIDFWVSHNSCNPEPSVTKLADTNKSDGSTIEHYVYSGGTNQIATELFKVVGGGHTWPRTAKGRGKTNRDINAAAEIWKFFSKYDIDGLVKR
jgi:polyhydroxybutyrate depolymerase